MRLAIVPLLALLTAALLAGFLAGLPAAAVEPDEILDDPVLEARARDLSASLRCLVCQNQSIDDSNARLARDLRILLRERLLAGDSDDDAVAFIVARYGDFVLLRPPVKPTTWVLWFGPPAILLLAGGGVALWLRRHGRRTATATPRPLDADEARRLEALLADRRDEGGPEK